MKISTLFAAGAIALACMLSLAMPATAGPDIMFAAPAVTIDHAIVTDVCVLDVVPVCAEDAVASLADHQPAHSFVLASLSEPRSIYELPIYVHFDPGRVGAAAV